MASHPIVDRHNVNMRKSHSQVVLSVPEGNGRGGEQIPGDSIVPGTVPGSALVPGSVDLTPFADTIRPVGIVGALPTLPDALYPVGAVVVLTTDGKLYRNVADAWVKAVDGNDLVANSVVVGKVAAGAIRATELAANAVTAEKMLVGMPFGQPITNPGFETGDLTGWQSYSPMSNGAASVETISSAGVKAGTGKYQCAIQKSAVGFGPAVLMAEFLPIRPGDSVSVSALLGGNTSAAYIYFYDYDKAYVSETGTLLSAMPVNGTRYTALVGPAPAGAAFVRVAVTNESTSGFPTWTVVDDLRVTVGDTNLIGSRGDVLINSDGISITNGKLTVGDEFGQSQLTAGGLTGGAAELGSLGLQNGTMRASGSIPAGRTAAFPYWTVSFPSGAGNLTASAWSEGSAGSVISGARVYKTAAAGSSGVASFLSDLLPIQAGATYTVYLHTSGVCTAGFIYIHADLEFYHPDGVTLQSTQAVTAHTYTSTTANTFNEGTPFDCPTNSKYVKVRLVTEFSSGANAGNYAVYQGASLVRVPRNVNDLVVTKDYGQTTSMITFPAESNDPGFIKHIEANNAARMEFSVSDDTASSDWFSFGAAPGGTFSETIRLAADGSSSFSGQITGPKSPLPWAMEAKTVSVALSAATSGSASVTWTASRFSQAPLVFVTIADAPGGSAKFVARAISSTTSGCTVYIYTGDATSQTATVTVNVLAIQMLSATASG